MSLRRTSAMVLKELRHITRDFRTFILVTVSPAFLLFTLAYVFSFDVNHASLAVMDLDKSRASRDYVNRLDSNDTFSVIAYVDDYQAIDRLLVDGTVNAALVIPPNFGEMIQAGHLVRVQLLVDGSDAYAASQTLSMLLAASSSIASEIQPLPRQVSPPFDVRSRAWYNATLKSLVSMVPGLLGVVLALPALALSLALTREKELGTFEGLLATPIQGMDYLLGKISAYVLIGISSVLLSWLVAVVWFQVPFRGNVLLLVLMTIDYFLASMGLSLIISTWVASQQTAMFIVLLAFFVPSFFLTGLVDPVNLGSLYSVLTSSALPTTHFITISRAIFLKGVGLSYLVMPSLTLLGMAAVAFTLSLVLFKKKLA
jgi:ABC-2 type transport system permease protein